MDDHLENDMEPELHIVVPKSQDGPATVLEERIALGVLGSLFRMPSTIELDHDHQLHAGEVDDVRADGVLPAKLEAQHPAGA